MQNRYLQYAATDYHSNAGEEARILLSVTTVTAETVYVVTTLFAIAAEEPQNETLLADAIEDLGLLIGDLQTYSNGLATYTTVPCEARKRAYCSLESIITEIGGYTESLATFIEYQGTQQKQKRKLSFFLNRFPKFDRCNLQGTRFI